MVWSGRASSDIRFRPIIVSAIVAMIGSLPAALSHGIGAEIQRPLARVVIGGLISSTVLTLLVLTAVHALFANREGSETAEEPHPQTRA
jgi:cobalt-zinc-cadmium resistance protein CzcA